MLGGELFQFCSSLCFDVAADSVIELGLDFSYGQENLAIIESAISAPWRNSIFDAPASVVILDEGLTNSLIKPIFDCR